MDLDVPAVSMLRGKHVYGALVGICLPTQACYIKELKEICDENGFAVWLQDGCFIQVEPFSHSLLIFLNLLEYSFVLMACIALTSLGAAIGQGTLPMMA